MATSLVRAARLVSHGVSNHPSMLVMTTDTPATESAIAMVPNWRNPATDVAAATITGPKYGMLLNTPAAMAQMGQTDDRARGNAQQQEPFNLRVDFVQDLNRDLLSLERRADEFHELPLDEIS
jgi:hypothetical protein